jgi:hypothetical protein
MEGEMDAELQAALAMSMDDDCAGVAEAAAEQPSSAAAEPAAAAEPPAVTTSAASEGVEDTAEDRVGEAAVTKVELLSFRVTHRKTVLKVTLPATATVADLHTKLEELTEIPVQLQKIMYKGGMKDKAKTLREVGIKDGVKMMLMGSKPTALEAMAAASKAATLAPLVEQVAEVAAKVPFCEEKSHKRVLEKGKPADAEPVVAGRAALPDSIKGLLNGSGAKVRLVFKASEGIINIATAERTSKFPFGAFPEVTVHPIDGHEGYFALGVKMGKTDASIRYFYWVPGQYRDSVVQALTGRVAMGSRGGGGARPPLPRQRRICCRRRSDAP